MPTYSTRQRELLQVWQDGGLKRINILTGSVRSGKTWVSLVLWALWVATMPKDKAYLMAAKTLTSLRRNVLDLLQNLVGAANFTYSLAAKEARLFGRLVFLEGANDARAETKIRGMTLQGAYLDELTLFTEDFFTMLLSRLSEPGAIVLATTNPDAPLHWVKANYLDRQDKLDIFTMQFLIEDNTFLDADYVASLKQEYAGTVYYSRYIESLWTLADGLVYPNAMNAVVPTQERPYTAYQMGVDYGISNPCAFALFGLHDGVWYMVKEYYHSGRETGHPKTDDEYYAELEGFADDLPIGLVYIDPSAASFIELVRRKHRFVVRPADNSVLDGIRNTAMVMNTGRLKINDCCTHTIQEFNSYAWDDKSTEDKPLKANDHLCDAIRYFVQSNRLLRVGWYSE